jgi:hypothetical protein
MSAPPRTTAFLSCLIAVSAWSGGSPPTSQTTCTRESLLEHVVGQFRLYGPQSTRNEHFGFIYRDAGILRSAVVKSSECRADKCTLDSAVAARQIPKGAKVLGEWHTHPRETGSRSLSIEDVRGALNNSGIRCYAAFYSVPDGRIYEWKPASTSVPTAMASRVLIGNYAEDPQDAAIIAAQKPGEPDAVLRVRMPTLRIPRRSPAEDHRQAAQEVPELRQDGTQEADVGTGVSPEGIGLVRDGLQERQGEQAEPGGR